jgi:hypothetical protein
LLKENALAALLSVFLSPLILPAMVRDF